LTAYNEVISTNTSTSTSTNTNTSTSTNTSTTTQTYVDGDGNYEYDTSNSLGDVVQTITLGGGIYSDQADGLVNGVNFGSDGTDGGLSIDLPQLELVYDIYYDTPGQANVAATPGGLVIEIDQTWDLDLDSLYNPGNAPGGTKELVQTYVQPDVAIVQDIFVEVEGIQDFTQVQEIIQSVSQPIAATGTRLVNE
jgi:hypothetical protein